MNKLNKINISKYIKNLKKSQLPAYVYGQGQAMALEEYFHPAFDRTVKFPKKLEIAEFYGKVDENHNFMNNEYKHLLLSLKESDKNYSHANNLETRVQLAKDQISLWQNFFQKENEKLLNDDKLKEDYKLKEDVIGQLREIWLRTKVKLSLFIIIFTFK
jgi:hypothetical protein